MKTVQLEGFLTVSELARLARRTPRNIRLHISPPLKGKPKIEAVNINPKKNRPHYLIPVKAAKKYLDSLR